MGQHDGVFAADDFVQGDELIRTDKWAGAVVDEDVGNIRRQGGQRLSDRILALAATLHESSRGRREGGELEHLALVAVDHHVVVNHAAFEEGGGGVGEEGAAAERGENLVRHPALHACAASGSEEDGSSAAHGGAK
jgi:hypothetical protein